MMAYAGGDRTAFEELYRRYAPRLAAALSRGLFRQQDAQDLLQHVFLQLHRHRHDYEPGRPFRPWIYTIAMNLKRQHFRTLARRPESELETPDDLAHKEAGVEHVRLEQRQALHHALEQLPEQAREVVLLHWFGGLPLAEVAQIVGASNAAVKVRAHRAYTAMRKVFDADLARAIPPLDGTADSSTGGGAP